ECEEKDDPLLREIQGEFDEAFATTAALGTASTSTQALNLPTQHTHWMIKSTNLINNQDERHEKKATTPGYPGYLV
ncbi:unnamed protein product, partial [Aphanomyces euteiches]